MSIQLVIVEDLEEVREGLRRFLTQDPDFTVQGAFGSAEEVLPFLLRARPDIVIMDIHLPGMSGIECIRQVRSWLPQTQFMMFTVYENDDKVFEALKAGAAGYLLKTAGPEQIASALKELYGGGAPMSANIARKLVQAFQAPQPASLAVLSARENQILQLLSQGLLYKEIASSLSISVATVRQHIHKIYEKLHVQNRTEALNRAFKRS